MRDFPKGRLEEMIRRHTRKSYPEKKLCHIDAGTELEYNIIEKRRVNISKNSAENIVWKLKKDMDKIKRGYVDGQTV